MKPTRSLLVLAISLMLGCAAAAQAAIEIRFNKNFESGALGKIEKLSPTQFRCHVEGQSDEHGANRQANWYYFRLDGVKGKDLRITLTDLVGEYNGRPGAVPMTAETIPVFSYDNELWEHFRSMDWDNAAKEATLQFTPNKDTIWVAHVPPYPYSKVLRLLKEMDARPCVRVETIGKSAQGQDLHLVTVTDFTVPEAQKKTVWLVARQHAWETGTSYVLEGALRFISSEDPVAKRLRATTLFKFTPTMDPDGCAAGKVRFNANGYDLNRHWDEVDLRNKELLRQMPEIWYVKKSIFNHLDSGRSIDLMLNLHNDETPEYLGTLIDEEPARSRCVRLFDRLSSATTFDPGQPLRFERDVDHTTNSLWRERKVPVLTMEQRIASSKKLGRQATADDRLMFGGQLIRAMAESVATE